MLTPGTIINDRYVIQTNIGQGGAGTVYRALDQRSGDVVALKHVSAAPGASAQLTHEARLLASLSHPALPKVTDYFIEPAGQFLAMDYVPGQDLGRLAARPAVSVALDWSGQLINVVEYLHSRQPPFIHRDIKPDNLKITPGNRLMLLDFGLAKGPASQHPATLSVAGYTPQYAPLEQIQGQGTTYRSDYYALAATIYQLLAGAPPADALTRAAAVIRQQPDPLIRPAGLNPALGADLDGALCGYLALNVDARPASLAPLKAAIARHAEPGPAAASS
ncbi:MAG TPA: serine/threonine-protein kinase, partial [Herpetosiphonaceae bacterium]